MMTTYPIWDWTKCRPANQSLDNVASSVEGGRANSGAAYAMDYSGGGLTVIVYDRVQLFTPESHRYWNELRARLNGGVLPINVPILVTWFNPFPDGIPAHEVAIDTFPARIKAQLSDSAADNAAQLILAIIDGAALQAGHIFSIDHSIIGSRIYTVKEIVNSTDMPLTDTDAIRYTIKITPPLREETIAGKALEFDWPRGLMRLAPGESMEWASQGYWRGEPSVNFIEWFPP